jgi:hypothetical protein
VDREYREIMTSPDLNRDDVNNNEAFVPVFTSSNHDAEMEAITIKGILESYDIPTMLVGPHMLPNLDFQVHVPEHLLDRAQQLIAEAKAAGPLAADEAEAESEKVSRTEL